MGTQNWLVNILIQFLLYRKTRCSPHRTHLLVSTTLVLQLLSFPVRVSYPNPLFYWGKKIYITSVWFRWGLVIAASKTEIIYAIWSSLLSYGIRWFSCIIQDLENLVVPYTLAQRLRLATGILLIQWIIQINKREARIWSKPSTLGGRTQFLIREKDRKSKANDVGIKKGKENILNLLALKHNETLWSSILYKFLHKPGHDMIDYLPTNTWLAPLQL